MSDLLRLAADFIEKMNNPSNGALVNEEYSLKMGQMMTGERFPELLRSEISRLNDVNTLSSYGWIWLIKWCRINEVGLSETLLLDLMQHWSNVFIQAAIIDLATYSFGNAREYQEEVNSRWLEELIERSTRNSERSEGGEELQYGVNTVAAENLLIALLQVGTPVCISATRKLLNSEWRGTDRLRNFFWIRFDRLDPETQRVWLENIRPPERRY